jgi:hypothetical protein
MATNYTWTYYTRPTSSREFYILKTHANNIKLVNLYTETDDCQKVQDSGYYGMNASFFNSGDVRYPALQNIVVERGQTIGCNITLPNHGNALDGTLNITGSSLVYWTGTALRCANDVDSSSDSVVPTGFSSWAQGGLGLYLCDQNWQSKYQAEASAASYPINESAARTGILINTSTKEVHLFACRLVATVAELREAMMEYAGLTEGGSAGNWAAIMTDGGRSAQLYSGEGSVSAALVRKVPQIIALKRTT